MPRGGTERAAKSDGEHKHEDDADYTSSQVSPNAKVVSLQRRHGPKRDDSALSQLHMEAGMSDTPSRTEIAAQLQAAEARTETRIAHLTGTMEVRSAATDHKIDLLIGKLDVLSTAMMEVKIDSKTTRNSVWGVGVAVMGLIVALWIAGINVQGNMIAVFQAGLGVRAIPQDAEQPKGPLGAVPPPPKPPSTPAGK